MDFKSLIQKIESLDDSIVTPKAPTLPGAIKLSEDAQMRVLAGQTTILAEAATAKTDTKEKAAKEKAAKEKAASSKKTTKQVAKSEKVEETPKSKKSTKTESTGYDEFTTRFMHMVEARKNKKPDADSDGVPDWADSDDKKSTDKKSTDKKSTDKKSSASSKKVLTAKQEKFFGKKKAVKESYEPALSFKDMVRLVQESGGQQQIDPVDQDLWQWAQRVAVQKFNEGAKAEMYAGLVYERMGGVFEMYDILSESSDNLMNEDESMFDKNATHKKAMEIQDAITKVFGPVVELNYNRDNSIGFKLNDGYMVPNNQSQNSNSLTVANLSKVIDPFYYKMRQTGDTFTQPARGEFTIGVRQI